jgi:predicted amidophosphoribosyltransferase
VAQLGESACASCGLVLLLAVRDDLCPACKYDLRGQANGPCPECGRLRQMPGLVSVAAPTN